MIWIKRLLTIALILLCCIAVLVFVMLNDDHVDIHLIFVQLQSVSVELAMLFSFVVGGLAGLLASSIMLLKMRSQYRSLLKKARKLD